MRALALTLVALAGCLQVPSGCPVTADVLMWEEPGLYAAAKALLPSVGHASENLVENPGWFRVPELDLLWPGGYDFATAWAELGSDGKLSAEAWLEAARDPGNSSLLHVTLRGFLLQAQVPHGMPEAEFQAAADAFLAAITDSTAAQRAAWTADLLAHPSGSPTASASPFRTRIDTPPAFLAFFLKRSSSLAPLTPGAWRFEGQGLHGQLRLSSIHLRVQDTSVEVDSGGQVRGVFGVRPGAGLWEHEEANRAAFRALGLPPPTFANPSFDAVHTCVRHDPP